MIVFGIIFKQKGIDKGPFSNRIAEPLDNKLTMVPRMGAGNIPHVSQQTRSNPSNRVAQPVTIFDNFWGSLPPFGPQSPIRPRDSSSVPIECLASASRPCNAPGSSLILFR